MSRPKTDPVIRFWRHVEKSDGCWEWTAKRLPSGYGVMTTDGAKVYTHRFSWEMHNGPIPARMFVCHSCDNPSCVRPDHLWIGTALDNAQDRDVKGRTGVHPRAIATECRQGHPYTGRDRHGHRYCVTCNRARSHDRYQRVKAAS